MERARPPRPADASSLESPRPLPSRLPLSALVEALRLSNTRGDVDALIRGLSRPLAEGESPRERANFLLSLIESRDVGSMQGTRGRGVRDAAVKALMNLGYPYALEVPPEALAAYQASTGQKKKRVVPVAGIVFAFLTLLVQGLISVPAFLWTIYNSSHWALLVTVGLLVPIPSALLGGWLRMPTLQRVGVVSMWIAALGWGLVTAYFINKSGFNVVFLVPMLLILGLALSAFLLRHPQWMAPEERQDPGDPLS